MESQTQIILISESTTLSINFKNMLDVKDKKIAVLSIQYPDLRKRNDGERSKRVPKDSLIVGDSLTVFIHCDKIKENVYVNNLFLSNTSSSMQCLDVLQLKSEQDYNVAEIQNPVYHELCTNNLFNLNVELRDLNGKPIEVDYDGYFVVKLGLK